MDHFSQVKIEGIRAIDSNPYRKSRVLAIQPGRINVIIGENGAGKSTLLDGIHALSSAEKLCSLQTENSISEATSRCTFKRGRNEVVIEFRQHGKDFFQYQDFRASVNGSPLTPGWVKIPKVCKPDANLQKSIALLTPYSKDVVYVDRHTIPNSDDIVADELNRLGPLLIGLASELDPSKHQDQFDRDKIARPIRFSTGQNKYRVYLKSDLDQASLVPLSQLPSGWVRYATICQAIVSANKGSVVLLDEPELNMHPKLQHKLMQRICELASEDEKNLQIFIATHSQVFINSKRWVEDEIKIYWIRDQGIEEVEASQDVLKRLGYKASDLLQTDGIIWVEGPSDRLYIEHWLDMWCMQEGRPRPSENVDYSYSLYGGAILSHFQAGGESDLIDLLKINRNVFVVIDNDNDFEFDCFGRPVPVKDTSVKARIYESVKSEGGAAWITRGYTIESYLVPSYRNIYFEEKAGKLLLKDGCRKVIAAEKYPGAGFAISERLVIDDLSKRIAGLYACIAAWSAY